MLNKEKHQLVMGQILRDLYTNPSVGPLLGFKGGTCAYLFCGLTRFSVDLDFDLLKNDEATQKRLFLHLTKLLKPHGLIKERYLKRHTIFFLISYGEDDHNIKIEIRRHSQIPNLLQHYEHRDYLGIPLLVAKKSFLFASKLVALSARTSLAMRDIYDVWFFAKNNWDIDQEVVKQMSDTNLKELIKKSISIIQQVKNGEILQGLGEILSPQEKNWVKEHLRQEVVFLLKNRLTVIE